MDASYHHLDDTKARARSLLTCPLCTQPYEDPRVLHCQHTFCCRCLMAYVDRLQLEWSATSRSTSAVGGCGRLGAIPCPSCQTEIGLPAAGAAAFPVDQRIQNIKELMVDEMLQDIKRRLKGRFNGDSGSENSTTTGNGNTPEKRGGGGIKERGHRSGGKSSRLGDIREFSSFEGENDDCGTNGSEELFEKDPLAYSSRTFYTEQPGSTASCFANARQKPGYSSLREPKRTRRAHISTMSFDDSQDRFEKDSTPRPGSNIDGISGLSAYSASPRPSPSINQRPKPSPFTNMNDDANESYTPIIGRNRVYSSLRERRSRPLFDPDVLFNKQADFLNEDVHASHRKEPNDRVSHCDSHFGYATKIGQDSPRFDGGRSQRSSHGQDGITRMPRASYSEPNWADKHYTANGSDIRSQQQQTQNSGFHDVLTANHSSKSNGSGPTVNESAKVNHNTCNASALLQQTKEKVDQLVVEKNHDLHRQSNLPTRGSQENVPIRAGIDVTESVTAVKQTAASYSVSTPITSNSQPVEPQSTKKSLGSTDSITSGSGSFTDEADSSVGTSGQSVIKEGTRSPLKSSTKLDQGESKFTRLSKFRKASKSGRCASVNVDVDGSSTVTVNAENNSPSMVRSQSVTDEADGKTRVTKTRARKRPPIFVGTPFNFNCNIVDNSDSLISSTDSKNDACPQDACGDNLKESIVVSSVTNTLSSSVTDCGASTMSEVPEIISELTSRLGTSSAVQSACTVQQDGETLLNTESSQTNDPVHSDLEKKDGLLERSSAAVGESVNVNQLWSQFPDNADEEVCAALGELDAVMMAACDEMQIVDEADITGDVSIQSNSGPCLDDDAVFLSSPRHIPGDAAVEDEKHLTDGVCSELLFSDPIDHNGSSQQPEKAGQLSENEVECHVNGDRVIKKSESDTDAIVNKDTDAEIQSGDIVIGACEEHLSQQQQMESSDCLDGNSKTYFKCDDRVNEDDAVFLENVTNGSKFRSETSETSDQGVKIDRNETSRVINGNCNGGTDDDPVGCDGSFITPTGVVTLFDGSLAITDSGAGCLCLCGHTGIVEHRVTGLKPFSVAVSGHDEQQSIFVGDRRRKTVAIFDRHGSDVAQWPENQLDWVCGITVLPNGDLAILDRSHVRQLGIYSSGGDLLAELGGHGGSANDLCMAEFLAIDSRGRIIVADSGNHCIKAFDPRSGASPVARFGSRGCGHGQLQWPKGVAVDAADNVLVADSRNGRVLMFSSDGQLLGTVVSSIRAPYAVCSVSTKSVAVTTYSVTGPSEFHLYDVST